MGKNLVIVESPAKAKTIKKYLGKDFEVLASYGHVRDLVEKEGAVDPANHFAMKYGLIEKNRPKVDAIEKAARQADTLFLATDPDREGEAISWHLAEILRERGVLDGHAMKRVRFYEVTRNAIREALENPEDLNDNLVNAQQARRALDYLVGFNLSPLLWRKIKPGLSAGRVQSVALRLICEREDEISAFVRKEYWTIEARGLKGNSRFPARLVEYHGARVEADTQKERFSITSEAQAREVERTLLAAAGGKLTVAAVDRKPKRRNPAAPFTTSTLQQEAARKLGFTARRTMQAAQRLYEAGFITYMRTDSVSLSNDAVAEIRETIRQVYGDKALSDGVNVYRTKSKNAQEAHEAIRPTSSALGPQRSEAEIDDADQRRLYSLVWKRAVASQMAPAVFDTVAVELVAGSDPRVSGTARHAFRANGQTLLEPGFLAVYHEDHDEGDVYESEDEQRLPVLSPGEGVELAELTPEQHFTQPPPRYTEASLVKALENFGIGRPSTYAAIIETLRYRKYVEMSGRAFIPTDIGKIVSRFLVKYFRNYVDYGFTARMEDLLDEISTGERKWQPELERFWKPFSERVEEIATTVSREEVAESRQVGTDPATGKPISVRMGQYGPFVQLGHRDDEEKPRFASLMPGQRMDEVTLEDALKLLSLPRELGTMPGGEPVSVGRGQFGPYVKYGSKFASIKEDDPFTLTLERAIEIVEAKKRADAERSILLFPDEGISVLDGRFGPYVTDGRKNAKVPRPATISKDTDAQTKARLWRAAAARLTLAECHELIAAAPEPKGRFGRRGGAGKQAKPTVASKPKARPKAKPKARARPKVAGTARRKSTARPKAPSE
jgi:DNA topoisomerase-1